MASIETKLRTKKGDFVCFENKGIAPTEGLCVDVDESYTRDTRFEAAVEWIRQNI